MHRLLLYLYLCVAFVTATPSLYASEVITSDLVNNDYCLTTDTGAPYLKTEEIDCGDEFYSGDLKYRIISVDDKTCEVAGVFMVYGDYLVIPERAYFEGDTYTVVSIGDEAFRYYCESLCSVTIPNTVTTIGSAAFAGCRSLKSITIPNSVLSIDGDMFSDGGLTSMVIEDGITPIHFNGRGCFTLKDLYLGRSLAGENINSVLPQCLETLRLGENVTVIPDNAFRNSSFLSTVILPETLTKIGNGAFSDCQVLTSIEFPESLTDIGYYAFQRSGLESVVIPSNITCIGGSAFSDCPSLKNIIIEDSDNPLDVISGESYNESLISFSTTQVEHLYIGRPFNGHFASSKVKNVKLGNTVTTIPDNFFFNCSELESVDLPRSIVTIGDRAFSKCSSLSSIELPHGLKLIDGSAFAQCTSLASIHIPSTVTAIGNAAFWNCSGLRKVHLSHSVETIGNSTFAKCALSEVVIPSSVKTIGEEAFADNQIIDVHMGCGVVRIGDHAFKGNPIESVKITSLAPPYVNVYTDTFNDFTPTVWVDNEDVAESYRSSNFWGKFSSYEIMTRSTNLTSEVNNLEIIPGTEQQLSVNVEPADATLKHVFWTSTRPDLATVDHTGLVTYHQPAKSSQKRTAAIEDMDTDSEQPLKIIAHTLYANGPQLIFAANDHTTGIEDVNDEFAIGHPDCNLPVEIFNINGLKIEDSVDNLVPGVYIIRRGTHIEKRLVK